MGRWTTVKEKPLDPSLFRNGGLSYWEAEEEPFKPSVGLFGPSASTNEKRIIEPALTSRRSLPPPTRALPPPTATESTALPSPPLLLLQETLAPLSPRTSLPLRPSPTSPSSPRSLLPISTRPVSRPQTLPWNNLSLPRPLIPRNYNSPSRRLTDFAPSSTKLVVLKLLV
jgi:hypothetical protein